MAGVSLCNHVDNMGLIMVSRMASGLLVYKKLLETTDGRIPTSKICTYKNIKSTNLKIPYQAVIAVKEFVAV